MQILFIAAKVPNHEIKFKFITITKLILKYVQVNGIPLLKKKQINCWKKTGKDILWKLCRVSKRATQKS